MSDESALVDLDLLAQVRAHGQAVPVTAVVRDGQLHVVVPDGSVLAGVAPGQTLVLYVGDGVLGSATVAATTARATASVPGQAVEALAP